jgi:hypothetical protein
MLASAGVLATSVRALPPAVTVMAALVETVTIALVVWAVTHPRSALGPHTVLDWVSLGLLNSSTGLWLLAVIRHRAQ